MSVIDRYLNDKQNGKRYAGKPLGEKSLKDYRNTLAFIDSYFADIALENWTYETASNYVEKRVNEGKSAATINREIAICEGFFEWLYKTEGRTGEPPFSGIARRKQARKLPVVIADMDLERMFQPRRGRRPKDFDPKFLLLFKTMYMTGLRIGEVRTLKKDDLLWSKNAIKVTGKGNKERVVPLHSALRKELESFIDADESGSPYIFHADGKKGGDPAQPQSERSIQKAFKTFLRERGLDESAYRPHNFRHTAASKIYAASENILAVKDLLGHSSLSTTLVYVALTQEAVFDAHRKAFGD